MTKKRRKFVKDTIDHWRRRLFLCEWHLDVAYAKEDQDSEERAAATCRANPVYMTAEITIYPCFWKHSEIDQRHMLVHELCHCITQSIWNVAKSQHNGFLMSPHVVHDEIEMLTQRISSIAFQEEWKK